MAPPLRLTWAAPAGAALFALLLWGVAQSLPHLAWFWVALIWLVLAAPAALVTAWLAALRAGHDARRWSERVRRSFFRGGVRVALAGLAGLAIAPLMVLRLVEAGPPMWLAAAVALFVPVALLPRLARRLSGVGHGPHALSIAVRLAVTIAALAALAVHLGFSWLLGLPQAAQPAPEAASVLVGEALILARLWAGLEAFVLGIAAEFGDWGRLAAALLSALGMLAGFGSLALAGVAAVLGAGELGRGLAPASDALPAPRPGGAGVAAAVLLAVLLVSGTGLAERRLAAAPPEARPTAQLQSAAELIGDALYRAGTHEALMALRAEALAEDAALAQSLEATLEAGFDAMEANVDRFLDGYYSLGAEYLRLFHWATRGLEGHLQAQLERALLAGAPHAGFEALLEQARDESAERHAAFAAREAALLEANRIEGANPARLRLGASFPALPVFEARFARDLEQAQIRWGLAAGTGLASAVIAAGVARRLAARGVLRGAAVALSRVAGLVLAFGVDYALLRIDEARNRDDFRAEIMAEIDALRREALDSLPPVEGQAALAGVD
ncbi:MAG: hypothetical protein JJT95_05905 [Pararhodobacter sp.]|nr:hypothetical protein [Pararhodobacter sp.]